MNYSLFKYYYLFVCEKDGISGFRRYETIDIELISDYSNLNYSEVIDTMSIDKKSWKNCDNSEKRKNNSKWNNNNNNDNDNNKTQHDVDKIVMRLYMQKSDTNQSIITIQILKKSGKSVVRNYFPNIVRYESTIFLLVPLSSLFVPV